MKLKILACLTLVGLWPLMSIASSSSAQEDEPGDIEYMRRHHRLTSVAGVPKPPGPVALHDAYRKHGIEVPEELKWAAKAATRVAARSADKPNTTQNSPGTATGKAVELDNGWLFPVTIGKTKNLKMVFDTGSADLWTFSTAMPASQRGNHTLYNPNGSGKRLKGYNFKVRYLTGSASGIVYSDKIIAGDVTATADIGAATDVAAFFQRGKQDGIVGFAFTSENTCTPHRCETFWSKAKRGCPTFWAFALRHNGPATWDFGFIDKSLYTGSIVYTPQMYYYPYGGGAWIVYVQGHAVGNHQMSKTIFYAVADTGTTLLLVYDDLVQAYYANVPQARHDKTQGGWVFPCSSTSKLPNLHLYLNGQQRTMPGAYGLYGRLNSTYCFGAVQSSGNSDISILGDVFLKSQYVVYNPCNNIIGFAQQKGVKI